MWNSPQTCAHLLEIMAAAEAGVSKITLFLYFLMSLESVTDSDWSGIQRSPGLTPSNNSHLSPWLSALQAQGNKGKEEERREDMGGHTFKKIFQQKINYSKIFFDLFLLNSSLCKVQRYAVFSAVTFRLGVIFTFSILTGHNTHKNYFYIYFATINK